MTVALAQTAPFIDTPGVYDIPEAVYHGDPVPEGSLSASGAKKLLPPHCPARFRHEQDNPVVKREFELGSAAHKMVLGIGPEIAVIDAEDWRKQKTKDDRDAARAAGRIPVLNPEYAQVQAMAAAIREHPLASALFDSRRGGQAERSLFWQDDEFGIWRRARLDWMPDPDAPGPFVIRDYKTCVSADRDSITKAVYNYGYFMQAPWYQDGIAALGLADDPQFVFVFQEKDPPYLINVARIDYPAEQAGRAANRAAMERYRDCKASGLWPGYSYDIELISLPPWARNRDFGGTDQ